ncbi:hypothetical protein M422DRAFT_67715 [Sphaerobolus stellatus SS14]|uniref:PPP4R2-domain-containing protein n=1 Tax=Sphaerobolus stellatus (strain SS14) TaxID=990650 RepID=A0A0C9ULZ6_SPHS4|nr:hypothetical protein M422DRAFT_67715 [Sphaerobolus stellatus SS14]
MVEESRSNGELSNPLEWNDEYLNALQHIAETDSTDIDWSQLREQIKARLAFNIKQYLTAAEDATDVNMTPEQLPRSSPLSLPSSSPSASSSSPAPSTMSGLVLPPFPKRDAPKSNTRVFKNSMSEEEATEIKTRIFEQLEEFEDHPPFTIQRLCELCLYPKQHYKYVGKYLRAIERTVLVTSTKDMYPAEEAEGGSAASRGYIDSEALRMTMTPVFSPIPFLHDDARRSRSPSPFELAATRHPAAMNSESTRVEAAPQKGIGLVDELDDPNPGHLADRPKALSAVTSTSLSDRFVKSSTPEEDSDVAMKESTGGQAEDAEVEEMVLDVRMDDDDKENKP